MPRTTTSVVGQDEGIDHGTLKGHSQHRYRKVPPCLPCRDAYNAEQRKHARPTPARTARKATPKAQAWNGGLIGTPRRFEPLLAPGACTTEGCGQGDDQLDAAGRPGWAYVTVVGSAEPGRWYCCGRCATYGIALAEIRTLRPAGAE